MGIPTKEYQSIDKSDWGNGPWLGEPDKKQWTDEATGYPCMAVRATVTGSLCGYVGVPESHPAFRKHYNDVDVNVHGGLTYADRCGRIEFKDWKAMRRKRRIMKKRARGFRYDDCQQWLDRWRVSLENYPIWREQMEASTICHVGGEGHVWWLGFDTAHALDLMPAMDATMRRIRAPRALRSHDLTDLYRDLTYVTAQVAELAQQLKAMEGGPEIVGKRDPRQMTHKDRMKMLRKAQETLTSITK